MNIQDKQRHPKPVLFCSAILSSCLFLVLVYLLWRGPPAETILARHSYLQSGMIFYPLCAVLAVVFAYIAYVNIKQIIHS